MWEILWKKRFYTDGTYIHTGMVKNKPFFKIFEYRGFFTDNKCYKKFIFVSLNPETEKLCNTLEYAKVFAKRFLKKLNKET